METKEIICVTCPAGCHITVTGDGKTISDITGYTCKRGIDYATNEYLQPKRSLTSLVKAEGYTCPVISVRSSQPIPKEKLFEAMEVIRKTTVQPPFVIGRVVIENIVDTGVDIILSNE